MLIYLFINATEIIHHSALFLLHCHPSSPLMLVSDLSQCFLFFLFIFILFAVRFLRLSEHCDQYQASSWELIGCHLCPCHELTLSASCPTFYSRMVHHYAIIYSKEINLIAYKYAHTHPPPSHTHTKLWVKETTFIPSTGLWTDVEESVDNIMRMGISQKPERCNRDMAWIEDLRWRSSHLFIRKCVVIGVTSESVFFCVSPACGLPIRFKFGCEWDHVTFCVLTFLFAEGFLSIRLPNLSGKDLFLSQGGSRFFFFLWSNSELCFQMRHYVKYWLFPDKCGCAF